MNQSNTTHEITQQISRKLLRMDVLTSETCSALNKEIIKQVISSWSLFTQVSSCVEKVTLAINRRPRRKSRSKYKTKKYLCRVNRRIIFYEIKHQHFANVLSYITFPLKHFVKIPVHILFFQVLVV